MENQHITLFQTPKKLATSAYDKILRPENDSSLFEWINLYFNIIVTGSPSTTQKAKQLDLTKFIQFFSDQVGHDHLDSWTPAVTKSFINHLIETPSPHTGYSYKPTSINRIIATLRHFYRWLSSYRPLLAGNPLMGIKDLHLDDPDWNGLANKEIMRLKIACEQRAKLCTRKDQNPALEVAIIYTLLSTGLRRKELINLNIGDYHHKGFHNVKRKGSKISKKIPVPSDAREKLDAYIHSRQDVKPSDPLFVSRYGNRLSTTDVFRICERIANQASAQLPEDEKINLSPHMLRHTFLKRVADKEGIHFAQKMSGNVSIKEVFRYTKPSDKEIMETAESLYS